MTDETTNVETEMPEVEMPEGTEEAVADAGTPESINLTDLGTLLQIVDLATQRGAFRGAELSQVVAVFDKLNTFLSYVQGQQDAKSATEEGTIEAPASEDEAEASEV